jgi:hypothetical protein
MRLADEVENGQDALALCPAEAAAELLQEYGGTLGRPQKQDRINLRGCRPLR